MNGWTPAAKPAPLPRVRLSVGVTGHRANNSAFTEYGAAITEALHAIVALIDAAVASAPAPFAGAAFARPRLHSMLADGVDQLVVGHARAHGWEIVAPLPFSLALSAAAAAEPKSREEADAALAYAGGQPAGALSDTAKAAIDRLFGFAREATLFELAERDARIRELLCASAAGAPEATASYTAETSHRYALASRVIIEQSDLMIAVWDGASRTQFGGTGHTIITALEAGVPVVLVPAQAPLEWRVLRAPEALAGARLAAPGPDEARALAELAATILSPTEAASHRGPEHFPRTPTPPRGAGNAQNQTFGPVRGRKTPRDAFGTFSGDGLDAFFSERWRATSNTMWHSYRRIEALFGDTKGVSPFRRLRERYELPQHAAAGSWAPLFAAAAALPGVAPTLVGRFDAAIAQRFAWADGLATHLSDAYRGGMVLNFFLSAFAIIIGLAYLPFASTSEKWIFAGFELAALVTILVVTNAGRRLRWHARWFEVRRVAEYLRHGPILLLFGVARPVGRWPRGVETSWPEWYARQALREVGLPGLKLTQSYLQQALGEVLRTHVVAQRNYHLEKARRLRAVHKNLDKFSTALFALAFLVVATYVALKGLGLFPGAPVLIGPLNSNYFTFYAVILPMLGATVAGVRYFGDFERFSGISEVAAEKLDAAAARIDQLLIGGEDDIDYESVSRIVHAVDDHVVAEIESWQAVFGGKEITIPV